MTEWQVFCIVAPIYIVGWFITLGIAGQYTFMTTEHEWSSTVVEDHAAKYGIATFWPFVLAGITIYHGFRYFGKFCNMWIRFVGKVARTNKFKPMPRLVAIEPSEKQEEFI